MFRGITIHLATKLCMCEKDNFNTFFSQHHLEISCGICKISLQIPYEMVAFDVAINDEVIENQEITPHIYLLRPEKENQ